MSVLPGLLLAEPDPTARLRAVDVLRERFEITVLDAGDAPVRVARRVRPALVLLALPRVRHSAVLRACRALKTELNMTYSVGLIDRSRRLADPATSIEDWLADGYLGGVFPAEAVAGFADALLDHRRPIEVFPGSSGLMSRFFSG